MAKRAKVTHHTPAVDQELIDAFGSRDSDPVARDAVGFVQTSVFFNALTTAAGDYSSIKAITGFVVDEGKPDKKKDGVYFSSGAGVASSAGHFVAVHGGDILDSYGLRLQRGGSDGFCQTFAMMNSLGLTHMFRAGSLVFNAEAAATFLASQCTVRNPAFVNALHRELGPKATCNVDSKGKKHPSIWYYHSTEKTLAGRASDYSEQITAFSQSPFFARALQDQLNFF